MRFAILLCAAGALTLSAADKMLFDFESGTYQGWTVEGKEAFGKAPFNAADEVHTWSPLRQFRGWQGKYMVIVGDTRHAGTPPGKLVSDEFKITHRYLKFLFGGETHPRVNVSLNVDGKTVRIAYGNNSYDMRLRGWDVSEFKGKKGRIVIEDTAEVASLVRLDHFHLSDTPPPRIGAFDKSPTGQESDVVRYGEMRLIFDPGPGKLSFYHSLVQGPDRKWHLYATILDHKDRYKPENQAEIVHAVSESLTGEFKVTGTVMKADAAFGEDFLQEPFVMVHNRKYYMFYVGSGKPWKGWDKDNDWRNKRFGKASVQGPYGIHLATSTDGIRWERHSHKPLFTDSPFAFTPYVMRNGNEWIMYYGAAEPQDVHTGKHGIFTRTSKDLVSWDNRKPAMTDKSITTPWPEHSFVHDPYVVRRGNSWYMLAGPMDNGNQSRFHYRKVFRSDSPFQWDSTKDLKGLFLDGGAKMVRDAKGNWYVTQAGMFYGGVWMAPVYWNDGEKGQR